MSVQIHFHDLQLKDLAVTIAQGCTGVYRNTVQKHTIDGKCDKAWHKVMEASEKLKYVQPTLDAKQKDAFLDALNVIQTYYTQVDTEEGRKDKRRAAKLLLKEAKKFQQSVVRTSALQMANIAIQGEEADAYRLYTKCSKFDLDPTELIEHMKAQLGGKPTSDDQTAPMKRKTRKTLPRAQPEDDQSEPGDDQSEPEDDE